MKVLLGESGRVITRLIGLRGVSWSSTTRVLFSFCDESKRKVSVNVTKSLMDVLYSQGLSIGQSKFIHSVVWSLLFGMFNYYCSGLDHIHLYRLPKIIIFLHSSFLLCELHTLIGREENQVHQFPHHGFFNYESQFRSFSLHLRRPGPLVTQANSTWHVILKSQVDRNQFLNLNLTFLIV
jgi:hypothetical protein